MGNGFWGLNSCTRQWMGFTNCVTYGDLVAELDGDGGFTAAFAAGGGVDWEAAFVDSVTRRDAFSFGDSLGRDDGVGSLTIGDDGVATGVGVWGVAVGANGVSFGDSIVKGDDVSLGNSLVV